MAGDTGEGQGRRLLSSTVQYCRHPLRRRRGVRRFGRKKLLFEFSTDFWWVKWIGSKGSGDALAVQRGIDLVV